MHSKTVSDLHPANVLKGKLLESETLLMNAIIGALATHAVMSAQSLDSETVRRGLKDILLNHARLYELLRRTGSVG